METEKRGISIKKLGIRTLSGIVLLLIMCGGALLRLFFTEVADKEFYSTLYVIIVIAVLSLIGLYEFYKNYGIQWSVEGFTGYAFTVFFWAILILRRFNWILPLLVAFLLLYLFIYVIFYPKKTAKGIGLSYFGLLYVTVCFSYLYRLWILSILSTEDNLIGILFFFLVFISAWGSDVFAYLVGSLCGKHKLAKELSPAKSVEGFIGGLVGGALLGLAFGLLFRNHFVGYPNPVLFVTALSLIGSVTSVIGDLSASAFKRDTGNKDFGHLIPGHGGILDRFDSILFTAPVIYYLIHIYIRYMVK